MTKCKEQSVETGVEFDRQEFFARLYRQMFPAVAQFIKKRNGNIEDAKDIFHDALILFYEKKCGGDLTILMSDEAYIFGIVRHLWVKRSNANGRMPLTELDTEIALTDDMVADRSTQSILAYLKSAGEKCMNVLKAFYYDKRSLASIESSFGFSSVRSATVQKYKCLEKVRNVVRSKSLNYEDFIGES